jgi:hypothetical protein
MEDMHGKVPLFKKIDQAVFDRLDKFKQAPNYANIQDFYNGLEEDQQKVFKGSIILILAILPIAFLSLLWWQNSNIKADLAMRTKIVSQANEILAKKQGLQQVKVNIISNNPIDSESMMTSRLSNLLSAMAVDLSKIQVKNFDTTNVSSEVLKSEANFAFKNLSTNELMNIFTTMIQREKFRISEVNIVRNAQTNFLEGKFHAIHFSSISAGEEY